MSTSECIVVVAGSGGTLGKLVVEATLARARQEWRRVLVRGLVRREGGSAAAAAPEATSLTTADQRLVVVPVDYGSPEELRHACAGADCVVSTLQGLEDVIVGVQSGLLAAAIASGVKRFVPSDFSGDFRKLPEGSHRNFDLRRRFHEAADRLILEARSPITLTSIFQGGFTELLASGWVLFDYKKRQVSYFGSPDAPMEFTTWRNTAEYTAAVAMDPNPVPRALFVAGQRLSPKEAQALARRVTGAEFGLKRVMPTWLLGVVIALMKFFMPGKKGDVMPLWVGMQYGYCGALGLMSPARLDNERYPGITWTAVDQVVRDAFAASPAA